MSTVALTVPGGARGHPARTGRRRSTASPRDGSPAWAGRSRDRCRVPPPSGRSWPCRSRSRRGLPTPVSRRPRHGFSVRCHPRGRTSNVASVVAEPVALLGGVERQGAVPGVDQVDLALDHVLPGRSERVLEIGHEDLGPRVERVDHHLALHRAGDLHPPVGEVGGDWRHLPLARPDVAQSRGETSGSSPRVDGASVASPSPRAAPGVAVRRSRCNCSTRSRASSVSTSSARSTR